MSTTLVTGAAGFMGSHVAESCVERGHDVVAVDNLCGGSESNVPECVSFEKGDIRDSCFVKQLWSEYDINRVFHLAAYAAEGLSHFIRRYNYENNLVGSINLLNCAVRNNVDCFVFTSSIAVYGDQETPYSEEMTPEPEDPYGIAKYAFEMDLWSARDMFGIDVIIFRPHNVYGERQNISDRYRNVVGIFMNQLLSGQPMTIFGDGEQTRAFTHISDVAPIIAKSPEVDGARNEVFNVGADEPYSVLDLAYYVADALDTEPDILFEPARNEVKHAYADHSKLSEVFELSSPVELEEGVKRMADWVQSNGPLEPTVFEEIEIEKKLPPVWRESLSSR
ncbi:UDP-glucose 4-epimerase [Salinibacter ruber]|uniref:NAD-dependent epimerase/dehydratase family protein n=1 Tax=Salinibacter ruber TaxID=146919 RepID=UPI002168913D|nr:NAD-dependent epimerase/dehydratase family protein [Salinibacter ruber]MCS3753180.1 UDP-glucose 4-epimerase [Salinibacter ruber]